MPDCGPCQQFLFKIRQKTCIPASQKSGSCAAHFPSLTILSVTAPLKWGGDVLPTRIPSPYRGFRELAPETRIRPHFLSQAC